MNSKISLVNIGILFYLFTILPFQTIGQNVVSSFIAPDTVCVNTPVSITNTSTGASAYYWNFCLADINAQPSAINLGNPGGYLSLPVFVDLVKDNGNFYGFVVNHGPGGITRLDFGNSLLNTPTPVFLGNISGVLNFGYGSEGIQIVKTNGKWYGVLVGGSPASSQPSTPKMITIYFGANLNNPAPTAISWGNLGNMLQPIDLHIFQENGIWYGFTVNGENNTITRFNFTNSFDNPPTAVNLGNIGGLDYPTGVYAIDDNGTWRVFVTNYTNSTITRLDFGSSLLNVPTGINLGNPGNLLHQPRDMTIRRECGQTVGFVVNGSTNDLLRLNFNTLTSIPAATSLGNTGNLDFPHSLSKLFRVGNDIYSLITNVRNNSITRIKFGGCTNSNIAASLAKNPPPITYNTPGTYNINLTMDDGLPTQTSACRQVVVVSPPIHSPTQSLSICSGASVKIGSSIRGASFAWSTGAVSDSILVSTPGTYWVESGRFGCFVRDSFMVSFASGASVDFSAQQNMCFPKTVQFSGNVPGALTYQWKFGDGQVNNTSLTPAISYAGYGTYTIMLKAQYANGCADSLVRAVKIDNAYDNTVIATGDTTICSGDSILLQTNSAASNYCWSASSGNIPSSLKPFVKPTTTTTYALTEEITSANLVRNPDFSLGNSFITSDYVLAYLNTAKRQYWLISDPSGWNATLGKCSDHTTGAGSNGNMMVISNAIENNVAVWKQTVAVIPGTDYEFSLWSSSLTSTKPVNLHFSVNDTDMNYSFNAGNSTCQWTKHAVIWNSGTNTTAKIAIITSNLPANSSFFALDDIFFGQKATKTDSVTVNVAAICSAIHLTGSDKVCSRTDTITYAVSKPPGCSQQYVFMADSSFATIVNTTPTAVKLVFKKNGNTNLKAFYAGNCSVALDSLNVAIRFSPPLVNVGPDVATCHDTAFTIKAGSGFTSYLWQNGSTDSVLFVNTPGTYSITAQNLCGIQFRDTLHFTKGSGIPFVVAPAVATACKGDSIQFNATGGTFYSWLPATSFDHPDAAAPKALVTTSQNFILSVSDAACARDTIITIPVFIKPAALIAVSKSNDLSCSIDAAVLTGSGGLAYTWFPDLYITSSTAGKIIVKPPQTMMYHIAGKNSSGCSGQDSITVYFTKEGDQKMYVPNAFTPDGNRSNDVFRLTITGPLLQYSLNIYNRWGKMVFKTNDRSQGWDGKSNGVAQPAGVYVYYVTAAGGCSSTFARKGTFLLLR